MANTLIKNNSEPSAFSGGGAGSSGGGGGGGGSGYGSSACQDAQNTAIGQLFPGYQFSAGSDTPGGRGGSGSSGGVVIGPAGDVWKITGGSCNGESVSIDYTQEAR